MFDNSVIKKTGQMWKLVLLYCGSIGGGLEMLYGVSRVVQDGSVEWVLRGIMLTFISLMFGWVSIRCPDCKAPWVWRSYKEREQKRGVFWLLRREECPMCKKKFHEGII